MINPQELRIGNLVKGPQGIERITDIGETLVRCELHDNLGGFTRHWKEIDPIPITPEILEKVEQYDQKYKYIFGSIDFSYFYNKPEITLCWGSHCEEGKDVPIKYLHELQNLFYSLYKEELIINL